MATQNQAVWTNPTSDRLEAGGVGIVPSKLTTAQRLALTLTANDVGLTCIDVTLGALFVWSGTAWIVGGTALINAADTQVLFDDAGAIAGNAAFTFNKTTGAVSLTGPLIGTSGTLTASTPQVQLAQIWNNAGVTFNGLLFNVTDTASTTTSTFLRFQVSSSDKFVVGKDGAIAANGTYSNSLTSYISLATATAAITAGTAVGRMFVLGSNIGAGVRGACIDATSVFGWSSTTATGAVDGANGAVLDTILLRDNASDTLALRRASNAQSFRVYNTYTDSSNYERGVFDWTTTANTLTIGAQKAGTGNNRSVSVVATGSLNLLATIGSSSNTGQQIDVNGNLCPQSSGSTTATGRFVCLQSGPGIPTGAPAPAQGVACYIDTTNSKFYAYIGGTWKSVVLV